MGFFWAGFAVFGTMNCEKREQRDVLSAFRPVGVFDCVFGVGFDTIPRAKITIKAKNKRIMLVDNGKKTRDSTEMKTAVPASKL